MAALLEAPVEAPDVDTDELVIDWKIPEHIAHLESPHVGTLYARFIVDLAPPVAPVVPLATPMLGPRQTMWLDALESGKWAQIRGRLMADGPYACAMGVAARVFDVPSMERAALAMGMTHAGASLVVGMNDDRHFTFRQIAAVVRANPLMYFATRC